ncbi:hypothetical protein O9929_26995 [Vibrio lentus]|nr:hypothetical protein [Vibrio lentus]
MVDGIRVAQMLTNLLSNAVRSSPHKGEISVVVAVVDGQLIVGIDGHGHWYDSYAARASTETFRAG